MPWTQKEINEIYAKVMQKATTDEEFRKELLANPKDAIANLTGEPLPDDYKIKVLENDPNYTATFVLPSFDSVLGEGDLEDVAGGACYGDQACGQLAGGDISKGRSAT
ncbi:MAG: NHLP leader peptide family RiPP precursor [Lactobacillales bacterium]|jgi:hypothetical protein|nr:NHLP leader peptide family RiPP precursor [Lactobacillales bacterium]